MTTDLQGGDRQGRRHRKCASRFIVYPSDPTITDTVLFEGRYLDEFAVFDGSWAFTRRHVVLDVTNHEAVDREGVNLGQ